LLEVDIETSHNGEQLQLQKSAESKDQLLTNCSADQLENFSVDEISGAGAEHQTQR